MRKKKYSHYVGVLLSEPMYEKLVKIADRMKTAISEYVRALLAKNLKSLEEKQNE